MGQRTVAIVHGTKGNPQGNWFPWLKAELEKKSLRVCVPQMPTPEGQDLEAWLHVFEAEVGELDESSILIGHSVGAVFALRYLEQRERAIRAAFLVAGFTGALGLPEYDALNKSFVAAPFDWGAIRSNAADIFVLSGDRDPYVPQTHGEEISRELGIKLCTIEGGGHLNAEFGFSAFPQLLDLVTSVLP